MCRGRNNVQKLPGILSPPLVTCYNPPASLTEGRLLEAFGWRNAVRHPRAW